MFHNALVSPGYLQPRLGRAFSNEAAVVALLQSFGLPVRIQRNLGRLSFKEQVRVPLVVRCAPDLHILLLLTMRRLRRWPERAFSLRDTVRRWSTRSSCRRCEVLGNVGLTCVCSASCAPSPFSTPLS